MILDPTKLEEKARRAGFNMGEVCDEAGVARSTFTRWKHGLKDTDHQPTLNTIRKLNDAVEALARRKKAA